MYKKYKKYLYIGVSDVCQPRSTRRPILLPLLLLTPSPPSLRAVCDVRPAPHPFSLPPSRYWSVVLCTCRPSAGTRTPKVSLAPPSLSAPRPLTCRPVLLFRFPSPPPPTPPARPLTNSRRRVLHLPPGRARTPLLPDPFAAHARFSPFPPPSVFAVSRPPHRTSRVARRR